MSKSWTKVPYETAAQLTLHEIRIVLEHKELEALSSEDLKELGTIATSIISRLAVRFSGDDK